MLQNVMNGIRPRFEEEKLQHPPPKPPKTKQERKKKEKKPGKRYKRVLNRVEHSREGSKSSYSSLESEWYTINSGDERMNSVSIINKDGDLEQPVIPKFNEIENPFTIKEDSKENISKLDEPIQRNSKGSKYGVHDEESDNA